MIYSYYNNIKVPKKIVEMANNPQCPEEQVYAEGFYLGYEKGKDLKYQYLKWYSEGFIDGVECGSKE